MNLISSCPIYAFILLLPWLALCSIENDKFSRVELSVLSPVNNSFVGKFVEVRFQLDFFNDDNLRVNPPFTEYVLQVLESDDKTKSAVLSGFVPWISIGYGPFGREGERILQFQLTVEDKQPSMPPKKYLMTTSVVVHVVPEFFKRSPLLRSQANDVLNFDSLEDDNQMLNDLVSSLVSHHKELSTTVALATDNRNIDYKSLVKLSPQIMEFFDWSAYSADCVTSPDLKFGPLFTKWHNVLESSKLLFRSYYDVAVVLFTATNSHAKASQIVAMVRFIYAMKVLISTVSLIDALITAANSEYGSSSFFTENIEQQSVQKRILSQGVTYDDFLDAPTSSEVSAAGASASLSSADKLIDDQVITTRGKYQETENGVNFITLRNGCLQSEGKLVALTTAQYEGPVVDHLNLAELNEFMDRAGFMPFTYVRQAVAYGGDNVLFINASAALVIPFYHHNVFHHFQSLAGLLSVQDVYPEALKYLLMPRYDSTAENQYEWSNGVLSLVTQFYESQLKQSHPEAEGLSVLFQQQFKSLFEVANVDQVCFKDLVVVGQVDTNRGFFTNSSVLHKFREVSYDTYAKNEEKDCGSERSAPTLPAAPAMLSGRMLKPRDSYELPQFHKTNNYLIRVTFSLRLHNRRILNLAALHKALIDSGVVDMEWLNHLTQSNSTRKDGEVLFNVRSGWTYLDNMSLQDQIKIFKETDLFIGVHGSAFINAALFMQPNSVCIALMQSRHIEFVLPQIIHQAGIVFHFLPILNQNNSANCLGSFAPSCVEGSLTRAGRMDCLPIRNCDVSVDVDWFLALVELSAYHIRANKRVDSWVV